VDAVAEMAVEKAQQHGGAPATGFVWSSFLAGQPIETSGDKGATRKPAAKKATAKKPAAKKATKAEKPPSA